MDFMREFFRVSHRGFGERNSSFHLSQGTLPFLLGSFLFLVLLFSPPLTILVTNRNSDKSAALTAEKKKYDEDKEIEAKARAKLANDLEKVKQSLEDEIRQLRKVVESSQTDASAVQSELTAVKVSIARLEGLLQRPNAPTPCCASQKVSINVDKSPASPTQGGTTLYGTTPTDAKPEDKTPLDARPNLSKPAVSTVPGMTP